MADQRESAPTQVGMAFGEVITRAAASGHSLDQLVRPLLAALAEIGGFDAAYLTTIDWEHRSQEVLYAHNVGGIEVPEGHRIACPSDLSEQVFLGVTRSHDLPAAQPDSHVARNLGLGTYVSVPIVTAGHRLFGTLCGASRSRREVPDSTVSVMEFFARLVADHVAWDVATQTEERARFAEEQLRQRAMFLARAEDELRAPLLVISDSVNLLDTGASASEQGRAALEALKRNAALLTQQVARLLEEARAEVQARNLHPMPLDVADLLRRMVEAFDGVSAGHRVRFEVPPVLQAHVDAKALYQVLGHLVDNAIKYSPAGTMILVRARSADDSIEIEVCDDGLGIPEDIDLFAPFQRGRDETVIATSGAGLGLHIAQSLTQAMGGALKARRNDDRGSTFTVRLPLAP